jgi:hypothetical protein
MTTAEILNRLTTEDIERAMLSFVNRPYNRKNYKKDNELIHNQKKYPCRELIMRATNEDLKSADNPKSFNSNVAKDKLIDLGFTNFNTSTNMYRYYLKKASKQDKTKTFVLNALTLSDFFNVVIPKSGDAASVSIKYLSDNVTEQDVRITKKQDPRLFIDRTRFEEGDILIFETIGSSFFSLDVINKYDLQYTNLISSLNDNYLLTNILPVNIGDSKGVNDANPKYLERKLKYPLNQILYGPPGTGKTYATITKALNIIGLLEEKDSYTKSEYEEAQDLFQNELGKRIEFITMHQSFSYEDFVQGLKPLKSKDGTSLSFDYRNGAFKEICKRADLYRNENKITSIDDRIDFEVVYNYSFKSLFEDNEPLELERGKTKFTIYDFSDKTLWFETSNGTVHPRYTLAKKTLKKIYDSKVNDVIESGNKGYFDATLEFLLESERRIKANQVPNTKKNIDHVIILDEINRANISRVFGELIALIEEDKRDGKLTATLPSGERFTVPSNLHIIGTMNTADKSIALVDIALRRRFMFIPLYPDTDLLRAVLKENNQFEESEIDLRVNLLKNLNKIIRADKSVDFEIGHSYFMKNGTLKDILNNQVLPLLSEYCMYDLRKVKGLIERAQTDKEGNVIPKLGITLNQAIWRDRGLLEVESID